MEKALIAILDRVHLHLSSLVLVACSKLTNVHMCLSPLARNWDSFGLVKVSTVRAFSALLQLKPPVAWTETLVSTLLKKRALCLVVLSIKMVLCATQDHVQQGHVA